MLRSRIALTLLVALAPAACAPAAPDPGGAPATAAGPVSVEGFSGPESVRYDPDQDVYFVSNFNGNPGTLDNNGFISRVRADGSVEQLHFAAGGVNGVTLHSPRGMTIVGDTLWAADADAVRGFHRRTGAPLATVSFAALQPGFLNDVTPGPDGALYVTDTPGNRIYRIQGGTPTVLVQDTALGRPNGITWDRAGNRFLLAPFGGRQALLGWRAGQTGFEVIATGGGGAFDGIEVLRPGRILAASQADSSLYLVENGRARVLLRTAGRPADIGVDTRRGRVAVPFVALNRVDILPLPAEAR